MHHVAGEEDGIARAGFHPHRGHRRRVVAHQILDARVDKPNGYSLVLIEPPTAVVEGLDVLVRATDELKRTAAAAQVDPDRYLRLRFVLHVRMPPSGQKCSVITRLRDFSVVIPAILSTIS